MDLIKTSPNMYYTFTNKFIYCVNPIQNGPFRGCLRMGEPKSSPLPKICHTYPTKMKLSTVIPYLKMAQKIYELRDTPLGFCWHQHFFIGNQKILLFQKMHIYIEFLYIISNSFNFFWIFKDFFHKHGYNFDDVSKIGYSRSSWNKNISK